MARYYICRRLGDGSENDPYNSEMRQYLSDNWPDEPKPERHIIAHVFPWCMMRYTLSQAAHDDVVANLTGLMAFPATALSAELRDIAVDKRMMIEDKLNAIGMKTGWLKGTHQVRDVLIYIARTIQIAEWADHQIESSNFDLYTTMAQIPTAARQNISANLDNLNFDYTWVGGTVTIGELASAIVLHRNAYLFDD